MQQYHDLLSLILKSGCRRSDRTGTGTLGVFGHQMRFDLAEGFPLVTTKRVFFKAVVQELLWFLRGETHVGSLQAAGVRIWDEWATPEQCEKFDRTPGELGPVYGHQWRNFGGELRTQHGAEELRSGFDQISWVIDEIKLNPDSRRLIVTAWNPVDAQRVALPPCHTLFQFYVQEGALSCQLYQRSGDAFLGVPFNIASYALLTHMIAQATQLRVGEFIHTLGDAHLYLNHIEQAREQLSRDQRELPKLHLNPAIQDVFAFRQEDVELIGYDPHPAIHAQVSV